MPDGSGVGASILVSGAENSVTLKLLIPSSRKTARKRHHAASEDASREGESKSRAKASDHHLDHALPQPV